MTKERYTSEEKNMADMQHVGHYLESIGLVKKEGSGWRGVKEASAYFKSLYIKPDGAWFLNNGEGSGNSPVELVKRYLMHERNYDTNEALIKAVKQLAGTEGYYQPSDKPIPKSDPNAPKPPLVLPEKSAYTNPIYDYLCTRRGINAAIVEDCVYAGKIFRTKEYGNIAFVAHDKEGNPKHVFLRGTSTDPEKQFRQDLTGSDKRYPFVLEGKPDAKVVYVFESSIDALSHASMYKINGRPVDDIHRISLHGTAFGALKTFLKDNPTIKGIVPCLDSDSAGKIRTEKMKEEFHGKDGVGVYRPKEPRTGKDWNEMLLKDEKFGLPGLRNSIVQIQQPAVQVGFEDGCV